MRTLLSGAAPRFYVALLLALLSHVCTANELPTVHGRVVLDENNNGRLDDGEPPLAGVAVTDGVQVVLTSDVGEFKFQLAADEVIPFTPARTVAVSWPSGHWPSGRWHYRLSEIQPDEELVFLLRKQGQQVPFGIVQGTDPHDCFRRGFNQTWRDDVQRMGDLIDLAVVTGDLSYISRKNADKDLGDVRKFTDSFPVPMFHAPGNHDLADIHTPAWNEPHDLAGNGGFTKHLGPVRWSFDYAGVHLVGIDWARPVGRTLETGMPNVAVDWLGRDLARLPEGTRTFLFAHQFWSPHPKLLELCKKHNVELLLGGHSHRNMDLSAGDVKMITTMSLSKLVHVYADRHELVDFCQGYRPKTPEYHGKYCHLDHIAALAERRGDEQKSGLSQINAEGVTLTDKPVGPGIEVHATLRFDHETPVVIRLAPQGRKAEPIEIALRQNLVECDGLTTTAGRRPDDPHLSMEVLLDHGGLEVKVNGRVYFCRPKIRPGGKWHVAVVAPKRNALLAEGHVWPVAYGEAESLAKVAEHYRRVYQGDRAEPYWRAIVDKEPDHVAANLALGNWLMERGRGNQAVAYLQKAARNEKHRRGVLTTLAAWYGENGRERDAVATYENLLKEQDDAALKNKLAWLHISARDMQVRKPAAAVKLAREICAATEHKNGYYLETLCVALYEAGELKEALEVAYKGFELAKAKKARLLTENMRVRVEVWGKELRDAAH